MRGNQDIMAKNRNNNENFNDIGNINTYGYNINLVERPVKTYKWCWKCSKELLVGSTLPFCDFSCQQEYCAENAKEIDSVWREITGRD